MSIACFALAQGVDQSVAGTPAASSMQQLGGIFIVLLGLAMLLTPTRILLRVHVSMGWLLVGLLGAKGTLIFFKILALGIIAFGVFHAVST